MTMKNSLFGSLAVLVLIITAYLVLVDMNNYQRDGELEIAVLENPVTVHRDKHGVPYIFAESIADAIRAQGFVVAQDRVFQMEMYRAIIEGRLASIVGDSAVNSDIKMRVLGIYKNAERHEELLDQQSKDYLNWYAQGYNEFIKNRTHAVSYTHLTLPTICSV